MKTTSLPPSDRRAQAARNDRRILDRARAAGAIRPAIEVDDISLLSEQLVAIRVGDQERTMQLRRRYLALLLDALRAPTAAPLPGPPPTWDEFSQRWDASRAGSSEMARRRS